MSIAVAPVRERGLKFVRWYLVRFQRRVAPVRERGLKYLQHIIAS